MAKLVIIGNGIAGVTVARNVRKQSNMEILIISSETKHFFSRTALMYIYMGHMTYEHTKPYEDWFWEKNSIELLDDYVEHLDTEKNTLKLKSGNTVLYDSLVLATGSKSNKFGWPGQDLPGVQGLYSYQDLELMEKNTVSAKHAVIVGGGLIGIEMAEMLLSRGISVTFLIREKYYWNNVLPEEEAILIGKHAIKHGVDLRFETELKEIVGGTDGRVKSVITGSGETIFCEFVGLTPGVHPNVEFLKSSNIEIGRGILVNDFLESNIPNIYACGDCAEIKAQKDGERNRIEPLWYTGKLQAEALANTICGNRTAYDRGIWFNSAKFFDIEYQTYGVVMPTLRDFEASFYWESSDNEHCFRIVFDKETQAVIGVNVFGIRMRHQVWEHWIREKRTLSYCMSHLKNVKFDPEFYKQYELEIIDAFNHQFPKTQLKLSPMKWFTKRFA